MKKDVTMDIRIEAKVREELRRLAEVRGSSISQVIRQAILEHLRKSKKERR